MFYALPLPVLHFVKFLLQIDQKLLEKLRFGEQAASTGASVLKKPSVVCLLNILMHAVCDPKIKSMEYLSHRVVLSDDSSCASHL